MWTPTPDKSWHFGREPMTELPKYFWSGKSSRSLYTTAVRSQSQAELTSTSQRLYGEIQMCHTLSMVSRDACKLLFQIQEQHCRI